MNADRIDLSAACDSLTMRYGLPLIYLTRDVQGKATSIHCTGCDPEEALDQILKGTTLSWRRIGGQYVLMEKATPKRTSFGTLAGTALDSLRGGPLEGATVLLYADSSGEKRLPLFRATSTNRYGFFSLPHLPAATYHLHISALGYRAPEKICTVTDSLSSLLTILMSEKEIIMPGVTVEGFRPSVFADAASTTHGKYIRSTPSDQNQYLLDGVEIFNPGHVGGVLSTFSGGPMQGVDEHIGGIPSYYGGRIGGIFDMALRPGTKERLSGSATAGTLGSELLLEGPVGDVATWMISGRQGYPDAGLRGSTNGTLNPLRSTELIAKLSRELPGSGRIFFNGYYGRDRYENSVSNAASNLHLDNRFSWGNAAVNLQWITIASPSLFVQTSAFYSRYDFSLEHLLSGTVPVSFPDPGSQYRIQDAVLRAHAEQYYDESHTFSGGMELIHRQIAAHISSFTTQIGPYAMDESPSWDLSLYMQDRWQMLPAVMAEVGARATSISADSGSFSSIDPRLSLLVTATENTRMYASMTSITEYLHPFRNSGVPLFYPAIFWYPSSDRVSPAHAMQFSVAAERDLAEHTISIGVESYYRLTRNQHEFVAPPAFNDLTRGILDGTGETYGAELTVRKQTGALHGTGRYIVSWARDQFPQLNNGNPYTPRFARRHEIQLDVQYAVDGVGTIGAVCALATEQTPSFFATPNKMDQAAGAQNRSFELLDINGSRLPGFQRLEFSVERTFLWGNIPISTTLRLLNGYGILDPFSWEVGKNSAGNPDWMVTLDEPKIFPLYPAVSVTAKF